MEWLTDQSTNAKIVSSVNCESTSVVDTGFTLRYFGSFVRLVDKVLTIHNFSREIKQSMLRPLVEKRGHIRQQLLLFQEILRFCRTRLKGGLLLLLLQTCS